MNTIITYRKASENDIDYLLDLRTKTMNPHYANSHLPTDRETTLQRILYQFDKAHIILLNDEPVGLLKINRGNKTEVFQLQIDPTQQGKGLGKKILKDILEEASKEGKTVELSVLKTNKAQHLYTSLGFKTVGEDEHSYFMEFQ
ncbi:GNAT family N-acetyltransferase [Chryseobacterium carnipullorum]|uniref:GNAT family N-acetyltransferase n=1 Tax=Chryseobacterium carnipullorum TaxID=1124835 RepID=A0A376DP57_CHRCU|nr:GNAT family N-acetyltransferase [Chryseobacterium carnipullorum]AZA48750.1 GNAT family N-acetyltransferase [Chryseobacterium carnipullorum]AZA63662.1 GNAT family N-acetyltransferase [Chryseobacterium carnipullorum]STC93078.1 ribosomal-protein-alanine N-acetyltransferase [Chryseobacterium carnipullorum]